MLVDLVINGLFVEASVVEHEELFNVSNVHVFMHGGVEIKQHSITNAQIVREYELNYETGVEDTSNWLSNHNNVEDLVRFEDDIPLDDEDPLPFHKERMTDGSGKSRNS